MGLSSTSVPSVLPLTIYRGLIKRLDQTESEPQRLSYIYFLNDGVTSTCLGLSLYLEFLRGYRDQLKEVHTLRRNDNFTDKPVWISILMENSYCICLFVCVCLFIFTLKSLFPSRSTFRLFHISYLFPASCPPLPHLPTYLQEDVPTPPTTLDL